MLEQVIAETLKLAAPLFAENGVKKPIAAVRFLNTA
jgi:hypothetical protein